MEVSWKSRHDGFSLIEVLVAVLVLSIGLLGVAAMQANAMKSTHASYQRSIATLAAQDAVERLWLELGYPSDYDGSGSDYPLEPGVCPPNGSVALNQIESDWKEGWDELIPLLEATSIEADDTVPCDYNVVVKWQDQRFDEDGDGSPDNISTLNYVVELPGRM